MAQITEIAALEARKRLLAAQSDELRGALGRQLEPVKAAAAWVDQGLAVVRALRTYWPLLAAATGFAAGRGRRGLWRTLSKAWSLWRLARKALDFWREQTRGGPTPA